MTRVTDPVRGGHSSSTAHGRGFQTQLYFDHGSNVLRSCESRIGQGRPCGLGQYIGTSVAAPMVFLYDVLWRGLQTNFSMPTPSSTRVTKPFVDCHGNRVGQMVGPNGDGSSPHYGHNGAPLLPHSLGLQCGSCFDTTRSVARGCGFGPYARPVASTPNMG
ncbi:hypothetical protein GOBAR_AA21216 [Gossypium barbadense]|uniref:Uncharacterized protein n=1 Tax=Gossypium barbadense TaxID=3634 RepID=A0A2P5X7Z1_GOSBA|nr:hypothetical protein GOBAR_AA21216 [Gossypium barbadense]